MPRVVLLGSALAALAALTGCARPPPFRIVAGSEQRSLAPLVQQFCARRQVRCLIDYRSPVDIGQMLAGEATPAADAVWPASGLWIGLYDSRQRVRDLKSITASPVALGVRSDVAERLGWIGRPVSTAEIEAAVRAHKLSYLAPSAARSSTGALAWLEMATAVSGHGRDLDMAALDDPAAQARLRTLLGGVSRSSGSAAWLKDLYLATAKTETAYPAIWATAAQLKETNEGLRMERRSELYAVYPSEGAAYAEAPLGFVEHGQDARVHRFFHDLQAYLLSPQAQARMVRQGRQPAVAGTTAGPAAIPLPAPAVTAHGLALYQQSLRRPSVTAYCLDFSGSMRGASEARLKGAMAAVLDPAAAARSLTQWTPQDRIFILPYDDQVRTVTSGAGTPGDLARLVAAVRTQDARGNGDFYACARQAIEQMRPYLGRGYLPAVVLMTDGRTPGRDGFEKFWRRSGGRVPVFGISYGKADKRDLEGLAGLTQARVFEGETDLTEAFRSQRAYN